MMTRRDTIRLWLLTLLYLVFGEAVIDLLDMDAAEALCENLDTGARKLLSLSDNLNSIDELNRIIAFTFDGLFSRDVQ